jgi:peptide/nickel transport system substrate-binding protein
LWAGRRSGAARGWRRAVGNAIGADLPIRNREGEHMSTAWRPNLRTGIAAGAGAVLLAASVGLVADGGAVAAGSIKYGGSVIVQDSQVGPSPRNFNPFTPSAAQWGTLGNIYEPLLMYNTITGSAPRPWLATRYQWSNGNRTLTFQIRKGVHWSDGKSLTAADVAFTFDELLKYPDVDTIGFRAAVKSVRATGAYSVQINFKAPNVPMLYYIGTFPIVPQHIWAKLGDPGKVLNPNPIGTGPFLLKSFSAANYVEVRNPHYWQAGKPYVAQLVYTTYSVQAVEAALSKGQITWANAYSGTLKTTYVKWDPKDNHYWFPPEGEVALFPNDGEAPFNNVYVREAISYAVNRQAIDNIGETTFEPPANSTGIILPNQKAWLSPHIPKQYDYTYDPKKALALFAKAGWHKNGQGKLVNAKGQQMSFVMQVPAGFPDWILDEQLMVQEFRAVGIAASSKQVQYPAYVQNMATGAYQLNMYFTGFGPTPFFLLNDALNSVYTAPEGSVATNDFERWNQKSTDTLLNAFAATTNPAQQHAIVDQLEGVMAKYQPIIPLVYAADWCEYRTNQFVGWPSAQDPYANPSPGDGVETEPLILSIHLK